MALDPLTAGLNLGDDLINAISRAIPDPNQRAELLSKIQQQVVAAAQASDQAQASVMASEAAQAKVINKPHIVLAWLCLAAAAFDLILVPLVMWGGYALGYPIPSPPKVFTDQLSTLLYGVFGLSGLGIGHNLTKQWMSSP